MKVIFQILFLLLITKVSLAQKSHFIQTQDGEIHYQVIGEGKPVLIINGGPGFSSEGFINISKEIASMGYRAVLFDQRGTGKSTLKKVDSSTITMDLMAQDIELIRKDLGVKNWILFGHSFGGMLANYYTSKFPEKVSAIIHSSSGGLDLELIGSTQEILYSRLSPQEIDSLNFWRSKLRVDDSEYNRSNYNRYLAAAYVYNNEHIAVVSQRLMQGNGELNRMVWEDMFRINYDCKDALRSFDKAVLILQGKQDIIPESLALTADTVFSNSELFFLDECGHYGWLDRKEEYLNRIKFFLQGIEKKEIKRAQ